MQYKTRDQRFKTISTKNYATYYGAKGDGTTDDTAAIMLAISALQGSQVFLYLPPGTYKISSNLAITDALRILGAGRYATAITWTSTTLDVITVTTANAFALECLTFNGPTSASAGAIVKLTAGASAENSLSIVRDVTFNQGYNHFVTNKAAQWTVDNCYFSAYVNYGSYVENSNNVDSGDSIITASIYANGGASSTAILQTSSGGLRVSNNKLLGGQYGYRMVLASAAATSDLHLVGNSVENQTISGFDFDTSGGGATFANVVISGNQLMNQPAPITMNSATGFLSRVGINNNIITLSASGTQGIGLVNVSDFVIGDNDITGTGGTPVGIAVGASCTSGKINPNKYTALTTNVSIHTSAVGIESEGPELLLQDGTAISAPADSNEDTLATISVPAKQLGVKGSIRLRASFLVTNSANNKTLRVRFSGGAGTVIWSTVATTITTVTLELFISNRGATNSQIALPIAVTDTPAVLTPVATTSAVDTTADTTLVITGQKASSGEVITLQSYSCELIPSRE